jgi:hypothetical protein
VLLSAEGDDSGNRRTVLQQATARVRMIIDKGSLSIRVATLAEVESKCMCQERRPFYSKEGPRRDKTPCNYDLCLPTDVLCSSPGNRELVTCTS